jgi:hypothetical protein
MTEIDEPAQADSTEQAEAAALAEALDRDVALPDLPADALEAAAFLRFNGKDATLGAEAEQRILAQLSPALTAKPAAPHRLRWWVWLAPMFALGAVTFLWIQQASRNYAPTQDIQASQVSVASENALEASPALDEALSKSRQSLHKEQILQQISLCDLAERQLQQGQPELALRTIADGLVLSATPSATLARLYEIKAQAHERRGEKILAGDSYFQALQINRQLLQESLGE